MERKKEATFSGTCWVARNQRVILAVPMINMMTELVIAQLIRILGMSFGFSVLKTKKPKMHAKKTAIAAASVAVKTPDMIPPRMMTGRTRAATASRLPLTTWRKVGLLSFFG